ncbi:type II secretion system protein [Prosthecobacter sp.]|uniref:type II secretion system protein n=1 Tax=Prosthecobacter sp. TaxID=1965333 RepID=UPI0037847A27
MNTTLSTRPSWIRGFSLVEMMACVSIIGIIAFMAIPSVTRMRGDSERNLAIARAEALNLAQASYIQVNGRTQAALNWSAATSAEAKYTLLRPYLSFSETTLATFMPSGYTVTFAPSITSMTKAALTGPSGTIFY